jgi:hypothetical protein
MARRQARAFVLALTLPTLPACAGASAAGPFTSPADGDLKLVVENHAWSDVNIPVERDGARFRLGMVMSQRDEPFVIKPRMLGDTPSFRLVAELIGSPERLISRPIEVRRDAVTYWTLEPTLWMSHVTFR